MFHRNGTPAAPPAPGGVASVQRSHTEFLPDLPVAGMDAVFYHLGRQQWLGLALLRWLYLLLLLCALLWGSARLPGGWLGAAAWLLAAAVLAIFAGRARRHGYVHFDAAPLPVIAATALPATHKVALYACGKLTVENKVRHFAGLPGFYRTFATREHALLCQVRPQRLGRIGAWPEDEVGLWYAFFAPASILAIQAGTVQVAQASLPALAIEYRPPPTPGRRNGTRMAEVERLLLAFLQDEERDLVCADLLVDTH